MPIRSTNSLRRAEGRVNVVACMKSQYVKESLQERISSQEPAPGEPEGGSAAVISIDERATISSASCSRWMFKTCLVLPKQSVSLFIEETGFVAIPNSSSRCAGSPRGLKQSDIMQPRAGDAYRYRET